MQVDFGTVRVPVGDQTQKIHLFVATLGYSRCTYVAEFLHERQSAWMQSLEGAFRHFAGITRELLLDNARALALPAELLSPLQEYERVLGAC